MKQSQLLADLRREIASRRVYVIVGAGVSIQASGENPVAGWKGLLEHGARRCEDVSTDLPDDWQDRIRVQLESGRLDDLLSLADEITTRLGGRNGGEYGRWLRESVGNLRLQDRRVIEALAALGCPLLTTNYDELVEQVTGWPAITWRQGAAVEYALRGDERAVVHVHGYWRDPESVVLGTRSYEQVAADPHTQAVLRALRSSGTLLFVGVGDGLADPHFQPLLEWARQSLSNSPYRHYRLVRDRDVEHARHQHEPADRFFVLPYPDSHDGLALLLDHLRVEAAAKVTGGWTESNTAAAVPPRPLCLGRGPLVNVLAEAMLANGPPIPILGGPGIGKSTLALEALYDGRVAARFGRRRVFVRFDAAQTADAARVELATAVGILSGDRLEQRLRQELGQAPTLLVLDNAETPWYGDPDRTVGLLLECASIANLTLVVTLRGRERPGGIRWSRAIEVDPLSPADACEVFLAIAGERYRSDPDLKALVSALDGLPLALTLMGHVAEGEASLAIVWERWTSQRTQLLSDGREKRRQSSAEVSFEISIGSPRMTEGPIRLLSLLGMLPEGIGDIDMDALLPSARLEYASVLRKMALAFDDPHTSRVRVLAPIREYVKKHYPPRTGDIGRAVAHYADLAATLGPKAGREGGAEAIRRLTLEVANIELMLLQALNRGSPGIGIAGALGWAQFICFSGIGTVDVVRRACEVAHEWGSVVDEANCLFRLAQIGHWRAEPETARRGYEEALALYRQEGDERGEANCILSLGELLRRTSDPEGARHRLEEARTLYQRMGDLNGEANCLLSLAVIARERSNYPDAMEGFEAARALYRRKGNVLGEANCLEGFGDVALGRSSHEEAQRHYEAALEICERLGNGVGEADCHHMLGRIAHDRSADGVAQERYETALRISRQVGHRLGEANCIRSTADIALRHGKLDAARAGYKEARSLFRHIGNVLEEASCIRNLADIARWRSDYKSAREKYEEALLVFRTMRSARGEANCLTGLGDTALRLSDAEGAKWCYEQALALCRRGEYVLGEANALVGLGDAARQRSDDAGAQQSYEAAIVLYRRVGDVIGEANCIRRLGDIARSKGKNERAQAHYEESLRLYRQVRNPMGQARCLTRIAEVLLGRSNRQEALSKLEEAMLLYRQFNDTADEAHCLRRMGDIALELGETDRSRRWYELAISLYRAIGNVLAESACIGMLGDVAVRQGDRGACPSGRHA